MLRRLRAFVLLILNLALCLTPRSAFAEDKSPLFQPQVRIGYMSTNFSGPVVGSGTFTSPNLVDLQFEYLAKKKTTYLLRQQILVDQESSAIRYIYTGFGSRLYFASGSNRVSVDETGFSFTSSPKWRFYGSWDLGIANMLQIQLSPVLGTYATLAEIYLGVGTIYQATKDIGIGAQIEYGNGFSFSNVSSTASSLKFLLGASFYY